MDIWRFNLRHLKAAAKIAELGTINAAAQAVNLSQPAITQALVRLEQQLGLPLFERRHDGMLPTEAADLLVPRIEAAFDHVGSPHVTMSRLRALLAVAESGSYAGASHLTGLSLPSIHRAVTDLALSMRRALVERRGKAVALTEAGRQVARAFRLARVELEAGLSEIDALKGFETRRISVGAMPLSRARVLPAAVTRFLRRHPRVRLMIAEGSRAELVEPLRNGALDLMIGALRTPLVEADLEQRPLFEDVPAIFGRKGHPLAGGSAGPERLAQFPWIVPSAGAPLRDSWDRFFAHAGLPLPEVPIESGSVMMIRQVVIDSDCLTLLSPDQVAAEMEAGWLTRIADLPRDLGRVIGVTTRASWRPTKVQREFLADLDAVARSGA
ncbi:MAG TPA: LysR family transcriptional regulator [Sphingobium sp.]|nr:LysR family transcriptional regulator [Sphingobium sp.]